MGGKKQTLTTGREHVEKMVAETSELDRIRKIDFNKEIEAKEKALLEKYLAQVVAGLKQENEKLNINAIRAKDMKGLFAKSAVEWNAEEKAAMAKLSQGLSKLPIDLPEKYWLPVLTKAKKLSRPKPSPTASLRHQVERKKLQAGIERQRQFQAYNQQLYLSTTAGLSSGAIRLNQVQASPKKEIRDAVAQYQLNKKLEKPKGKEKWYQNLPAKTKAWYEKQTTFTKAILIGGGALLTTVVAVKLAKYFWKKITSNEKEKAEGGISAAGVAAGAGILSLLGLGIYNRGKIGTWFRELFGGLKEGLEGVKEQANTLKKMQESATLLAAGKPIDAFKKWIETPDPEEELHEKVSHQFKEWNLKLPQESLRLVGTMSYGAFMEQQDSWGSYMVDKLNKLQAAFDGDQILTDIYAARPDISDGNESLAAVFKKLESVKGSNGKPLIDRAQMKYMPVDEVLRIVMAKDLSGISEQMKEVAYEESRDWSEKGLDAAKAGAERVAEASSVFLKAFQEELGSFEKEGLSINDIIVRYETQQELSDDFFEGIGHRIDLASDIADILSVNGMNLIVAGPKILVMKGPKIVLESSWNALSESFMALMHGDLTEAPMVYLSGAGPLIVFGVTTGAAWGGARGTLAYLSKRFGEAGVIKGVLRGGIGGAKQGALLPARLLKAGVSGVTGLSRNLLHFGDYSQILYERMRLAKEWTKAKTLGRLSSTVEEAFDIKHIHLLQRQLNYIKAMRSSNIKIPFIDRARFNREIQEIGKNLSKLKLNTNLTDEMKYLVTRVAEKVDDFKTARSLINRPKLIQAMAQDANLERIFMSQTMQEALKSKDFMKSVDKVIKGAKKLSVDELAAQLKQLAVSYDPRVAKLAALSPAKALKETGVGVQYRGRLTQLKGRIRELEQMIIQTADANKIKISEFKATHRTGKELARQLERLTAEADQMKRLVKVLEKSKSAYGQLLRDRPYILSKLSQNNKFSQARLDQFLALDKRLIHTFEKQAPKRLFEIIDAGLNLEKAKVNQVNKIASLHQQMAKAAKTLKQPIYEFLATDAAKPLMHSVEEAEETLRYIEITQRAVRSNRSPFGKVLRESPELLQKIMSNAEVRSQFFALDKRVVKYLSKNTDQIADFAKAIVNKDTEKFNKTLVTIGDKLKIKNILKAQHQRLAKGLSYASEQLGERAGRLFKGVQERGVKGFNELMEKFRRTPGFKIDIDDLNDIVKAKNAQAIRNLLTNKGLPIDNLEASVLDDAIKRMTQAEDAVAVKHEIEALAKLSNTKVSFSPKALMALKALRGLGAVASFVGVGYSAWEVGSSGYGAIEAYQKGQLDRAQILSGRAGLFGVNLVADTAGAYVLVGAATGKFAAGAVGTSLGAVALPLIPITYVGTSIAESMYERTKTHEEWAQTHPTQLIHEWISTGGTSAGDAYRQVLTTATYKSLDKEHQQTREKIVQAILKQQDGEVNQDRLDFMKKIYNFETHKRNHQHAQEILEDSKLYATMMEMRRQAKQQGLTELPIGKIDLMEKQYEKPNLDAMLGMVRFFKKEKAEALDPQYQKNFELLSTGALIDLAYQLRVNAETYEKGVNQNQAAFLKDLESYLTYQRRVNLPAQYYLRKDKLTKKSAKEVFGMIDQFDAGMDQREVEKSISKTTDSAAVYAMYKLAEFFGYQGHQEIEELKEFFVETNKDATGVYWDGESWYVNEAGWELDDEIGPELNETAIEKIIALYEAEDENSDIFGHRQDSVFNFYAVVDFAAQANKNAEILKKALKTYPKSKKTSPKPKKHEPPPKERAIERTSGTV